MADKPLLQLVNLMSGALGYETPASEAERKRVEAANEKKRRADRLEIPPGFVEGSETWEAARLHNWPLVENLPPTTPAPAQGDMFATAPAPLARRYDLAEEFMEEAFPIRLGGDPPDGAEDTETLCFEHSAPFAWDEEHVLTSCSRGWCLIERGRWADGWRHCPGC